MLVIWIRILIFLVLPCLALHAYIYSNLSVYVCIFIIYAWRYSWIHSDINQENYCIKASLSPSFSYLTSCVVIIFMDWKKIYIDRVRRRCVELILMAERTYLHICISMKGGNSYHPGGERKPWKLLCCD